MSDSSLIFYRNIEDSDCSYLPDLKSNSIFIDPESKPTKDELNILHRQGFRRSGKLVYRPQCPTCNALKRNQDLRLQWVEPEFKEEHYLLYEQYIAQRHQDGEMFPASREQYQGFLIAGHGTHKFLELRDSENTLVGCCAVDIFYDGLSAIYSYFDPKQHKRSIGRFIVLALISQGQQMNLPYTYLGYWIKKSSKMNYKADYQPLEVFDGENWRKLISNEPK
jgi:arginyl-tRNA--protein-N-Asp/Glu arginylyltransferase